jgi:hypothetical protein
MVPNSWLVSVLLFFCDELLKATFWYTSVITATQEVEVRGSWLEARLGKKISETLYLKK